jgi:hypothetical protein
MHPKLWTILERVLTLLIIALLLGATIGDEPDRTLLYNRLASATSGVQFSYAGWMGQAIEQKIVQEMTGNQDYLSEAQRSAYVRTYLQAVANLQVLDGRIAAIYADSKIPNPDQQSADLRARRVGAQSEVARLESLAESIAESQVAAVLADEGFAVLGQIIPPVAAKITQLPALLVISPRNAIRVEASVNVINLSADQASSLEDTIDHSLNVSSLVVPLGGLSLFPSMVIQTWHAPTLFEVIAHEWCHHYLYFFPLGWSYDSPEARILNESTAVLFGREIGRKVVERYYQQFPDILAQLPPRPTATPGEGVSPTPAPTPGGPAAFDFGAAMNETRVQVDALLAAGNVDAAETYLKQRRAYFAANGVAIRKLNTAYFAFYGGYQGAGGSSASGADPTGPALAKLRADAGSIHAWLEKMRAITTRDALLAAANYSPIDLETRTPTPTAPP